MILRLEASAHRLEIHPTDAKAVVGRSEDCEYLLDDPSVSRRHMEVFYRASKGWTIRDLESSKGTFLNGVRMTEPLEVYDGDLLKLGNITFTVVLEGGVKRVKQEQGTKVLDTVGATPARPSSNPELRMLENADAGVASSAKAIRNDVEVNPEISDAELERREKRRLAMTHTDNELFGQLTPVLLIIGTLLVLWVIYRMI